MHESANGNSEKSWFEMKFLEFYNQVDRDERLAAEQTFESIIQRLESCARATIYKMIGKTPLYSHEEDLLSSLWMAIWGNAYKPSLRWKAGMASPKTLALAILRKKILDLARKHYQEHKVRFWSFQEDGGGLPDLDVAEKSLPPLEQMVRDERDALVRAGIRKLPCACRELVWKKYILGMKSREIALVVKTSQGTVSKKLTQGEKALAKFLGPEDLLME